MFATFRLVSLRRGEERRGCKKGKECGRMGEPFSKLRSDSCSKSATSHGTDFFVYTALVFF